VTHPHLRIPGPDAVISAAGQVQRANAGTTGAAAMASAGAPLPHPTAIESWNLDDTARHVLALAEEPDALARIRAILAAAFDRGAETAETETDEKWRELLRDRAASLAGTGDEELDRARQATIRGDANLAAAHAVRAASLADRAAAFRTLLR
jgi:hypothetical protein